MADYVEITIEQNATFNTTVTINDGSGIPFNLTGYTGKAQIRKSYYSSTAHDFVITVPSPALGELTLTMSAAVTANVTPGRYVYDLIIVQNNTNVVTRIFEGIAVVRPGVTRNE